MKGQSTTPTADVAVTHVLVAAEPARAREARKLVRHMVQGRPALSKGWPGLPSW